MENEILEKMSEQDKKINDIYISVEKTRKYFKWTLITSVIFFVLPLVIILMILPSLMSGITDLYNI